jgi:hypothetical protein
MTCHQKRRRFPKIYWSDITSLFWHVIAPILGLILIAVLVLYGLPALQQDKIRRDEIHAVVSYQTFAFNDTVALIKYNYGFWGGLGGIVSTTVTMTHGTTALLEVIPTFNGSAFGIFDIALDTNSSSGNQTSFISLGNQTVTEFTFSGNLGITSGSLCQVTYEVTTHRDNQTELNPISITQLSG